MQVRGRVVISTLVVVGDLTVHASERIADCGDGPIRLSGVRRFDLVVLGWQEAVSHRRGNSVLQEVWGAAVHVTLLLLFSGRRGAFAILVWWWLLRLLETVCRYDLPGSRSEVRTTVGLQHRFRASTWKIVLSWSGRDRVLFRG